MERVIYFFQYCSEMRVHQLVCITYCIKMLLSLNSVSVYACKFVFIAEKADLSLLPKKDTRNQQKVPTTKRYMHVMDIQIYVRCKNGNNYRVFSVHVSMQTEPQQCLPVFSTSKNEDMMGGCGLGRACDHNETFGHLKSCRVDIYVPGENIILLTLLVMYIILLG